jgi:hypothetical protein
MARPKNQDLSTSMSLIYEIRLQGSLHKNWSDWLGGMVISHDDDNTTLRGKVLDQAALRGILSRIWDLNLTVISVNQIRETQVTLSGTQRNVVSKQGGKEMAEI